METRCVRQHFTGTVGAGRRHLFAQSAGGGVRCQLRGEHRTEVVECAQVEVVQRRRVRYLVVVGSVCVDLDERHVKAQHVERLQAVQEIPQLVGEREHLTAVDIVELQHVDRAGTAERRRRRGRVEQIGVDQRQQRVAEREAAERRAGRQTDAERASRVLRDQTRQLGSLEFAQCDLAVSIDLAVGELNVHAGVEIDLAVRGPVAESDVEEADVAGRPRYVGLVAVGAQHETVIGDPNEECFGG